VTKTAITTLFAQKELSLSLLFLSFSSARQNIEVKTSHRDKREKEILGGY
jgi:hypothetical protein